MEPSRWLKFLSPWLAIWMVGLAHADESPPPVRSQSAWKTERLVTTNGKVHEGLTELRDAERVVFLELVRPPGRPMFAVRRPYPLSEIRSLETLSPADRDAFRAHWHRHLRRARIDSERLDQLELQRVSAATEPPAFQYQGAWFALTAQAEEAATRQTIAHLEQTFAALRHLLPPQPQLPEHRLTVRLFSQRDEYVRFSRQAGLDLEHTAYFDAEQNIIAMHSQLERITLESEAASQTYDEWRIQLETLRKELPERLKDERAKLEMAQRPEAEVRQYLVRLRSELNKRIDALKGAMDRANRQKQQRIDEQTAAWLKTLRHEACHAYVQNYLFPLQRYRVPTWLHEGLAQVLAHGILEDGLLRVDAPDPEVLKQLQADLRGEPLPLEQLLRAQNADFLVTTPDDRESSRRLYAYAWGLTWFLLFDEQQGWTVDQFAQLVRPEEKGETYDAAERFARVVGEDRAAFEQRWRAAMREWTPTR